MSDTNHLALLPVTFILLITLGCAGRSDQSFASLMESAHAGDPAAQTELAFLYMTGRAGEVDRAAAIRWYTKASKQGDPQAMDAMRELGFSPVGTAWAHSEEPVVDLTAEGRGLDFGRFHALVIGNAAYDDFPLLHTSVRDAIAISELLRSAYGFEVSTILDGTWEEMRDAMYRYRTILTPDDNLLIYYAGHGWADKKTEEAYWLPVDADSKVDSRWISNSTITTTLKGIDARHVLVVADSCFSGTLVRGIGYKPSTRSPLERLNARRSRTALTSGGIEPVVDTGANGHSVFANAFIRILSTNTGVLEATALHNKIRRPVMINADQTPLYGDIRKAGHEDGDFLFVRVNREAKGSEVDSDPNIHGDER